MTRLNFICEFKSDIVLHSSSNTEGKVDKFNYIAGSNFLGMVARAYPSFGTDAFEVFHSGKVRFLDGHIVENGEKTFHAPFSWFAPKGTTLSDAIENNELFNDHFITPSEYEAFIEKGIQLKQQRGSFIRQDGSVAKLNSNYRQKSAYDKGNRRSKDSAMFGYYALAKGTKWAFEVEMEDANYKNEIIKLLESSNRLGKSRSAEYGRVKIKFVDEKENSVAQVLNPIIIDEKSYIFIYAHSRLALMNDYGVNSYQPTISSLKLDEGCKIDWDKSQVRTSRYTPYVSIRHNRDPERLIIDKGSVITIKVQQDFDVEAYSKKVQKGLGLYLSEGHGQVIVNPAFLNLKKPSFQEAKEENLSENQKDSLGLISTWLEQQQKEEKLNYELLKEVKEFISKHNVKNKKAQWGQVRSLTRATINSDDLHKALFDKTEVNGHLKGFLLHGQAKDKWNSKLIEALRDRKLDDKYHDFIKILSIYAPKEDDKKEEKSDV
ncbi:MAG: FIG00470522: hypothetical protein [uncultured Sulfurovum sp.]|uniref:Uncharacterized protein n=1 Tax=uncultured Sulfurovum sp. TaxID=269237 RepID=A0A6S6T3G7_9BACT|nr:MAG: FIG00470522: hypothetical protein [uncultured Sulfurovum sp.]